MPYPVIVQHLAAALPCGGCLLPVMFNLHEVTRFCLVLAPGLPPFGANVVVVAIMATPDAWEICCDLSASICDPGKG